MVFSLVYGFLQIREEMPMNKTLMIAAAAFVASVLAGCCIDGSGDVVKETRRLSKFNRIRIETSGSVSISKGDRRQVTVRTDDNIIDRIDTDVRNGTLHIDLNPSTCIDPTTLRINIQTPEIEKLRVDGSSDIAFKDGFEGEALKIALDGSGDITAKKTLRYDTVDVVVKGSGDVTLAVDTADLLTIIEGSGDIKYTGFAAIHDVDIEGSGDLLAYGLETDEAKVDIDGSGSCKLSVTETLEVSIEGSGDVLYRGAPEVSKELDGSGRVKKTD